MILLKDDVDALLDGCTVGWARPVGRHPLAEGDIVKVQPGRYKAHAIHARVSRLNHTTAGALRRRKTWNLPAGWGDHDELEMMELIPEPVEACCVNV